MTKTKTYLFPLILVPKILVVILKFTILLEKMRNLCARLIGLSFQKRSKLVQPANDFSHFLLSKKISKSSFWQFLLIWFLQTIQVFIIISVEVVLIVRIKFVIRVPSRASALLFNTLRLNLVLLEVECGHRLVAIPVVVRIVFRLVGWTVTGVIKKMLESTDGPENIWISLLDMT